MGQVQILAYKSPAVASQEVCIFVTAEVDASPPKVSMDVKGLDSASKVTLSCTEAKIGVGNKAAAPFPNSSFRYIS